MLEFVLDYFFIFLAAIYGIGWLIYAKMEYFPNKPRYSENLMEKYLNYRMYMRHEKNTRKYFPNNKLNK